MLCLPVCQYFTSRLKDTSVVISSANQTEVSSDDRTVLEAIFNNVMTLCAMLPLLICTCLNSFLLSLWVKHHTADISECSTYIFTTTLSQWAVNSIFYTLSSHLKFTHTLMDASGLWSVQHADCSSQGPNNQSGHSTGRWLALSPEPKPHNIPLKSICSPWAPSPSLSFFFFFSCQNLAASACHGQSLRHHACLRHHCCPCESSSRALPLLPQYHGEDCHH